MQIFISALPLWLFLLDIVQVEACLVTPRPKKTTTTTAGTTTTRWPNRMYLEIVHTFSDSSTCLPWQQCRHTTGALIKCTNNLYVCSIWSPSTTTTTTTTITEPSISSCTESKSGKVQCKDGTCIDVAKVCDGTNDCAAGEDEDECREFHFVKSLMTYGWYDVISVQVVYLGCSWGWGEKYAGNCKSPGGCLQTGHVTQLPQYFSHQP